MARTIPTVEPITARAGLTWEWDPTPVFEGETFLPSNGWTLTYSLTGAAATVLTITAATSASSDYFEVRVPKATTATYTAGRYDLIGVVDDGRDAFEVYRGPLVVEPATSAAPELSFAEQMLAAVETKIADRTAADISGYTLEQQAVQRESLADLRRQRAAYADAVRRERGGKFFQPVAVSFETPA